MKQSNTVIIYGAVLLVVLPLNALSPEPGVLTCSIEVPAHQILLGEEGEAVLWMDGATYGGTPGYPRMPRLIYTFALPPGTEPVTVEFSGSRETLPGKYQVQAVLPPMPMSTSDAVLAEINLRYEETRAGVYSGKVPQSNELGWMQSASEYREYSLVTVAGNPFSYDPVTGKLDKADYLAVNITYAPADEAHQDYIQGFMETGSLNEDVPCFIFNKNQARAWYQPRKRHIRAPRMIILTLNSLQDAVTDYADWRSSTGFEVAVATVEDITSITEGRDTQEKIRNWLRENARDYDYLFIIGHHWDIPMRTLNAIADGDNPYGDANYCPHPTDLYYADLSKPDEESWDSDGDGYYGETWDYHESGASMDAPDMAGELAVGRLNTSQASDVTQMLARIKDFETSSSTLDKKTSVLTAGMYHFFGNNDNIDGADFTEYLIDSGILSRSFCTTLYEKEGSDSSDYGCDLPVTNSNLTSVLASTDESIFVEAFHGWHDGFFRKVWYDDGDGIPEVDEYGWPPALTVQDAPGIASDNSFVAYLISCLCAKPEVSANLSMTLMKYASVGVLAYTRVCWGCQEHVWTGPECGYASNFLFYNSIKSYYQDGDSQGEGWRKAMAACGNEGEAYERMNAYGLVVTGDPALKRHGWNPAAKVEAPDVEDVAVLRIDSFNRIHFNLNASGLVIIKAWDVSGRRAQTVFEGILPEGYQCVDWNTTSLPNGTYFITLRESARIISTKTVIIN